MKIYIANSSDQKIGGGWSFIYNFKKGMDKLITSNYEEATHYLISGATMVQRVEIQRAISDGKKIVFRIDNAVRNSRNRNTGMSRMQDFAKWADIVIYQSQWAKDYLMPFTGVDGPVIINGADIEIFNKKDRIRQEGTIYGYCRYNRDETKNWELARYEYSQIQLKDQNAKLWILGQFSPELLEGNFDFYNGEKIVYLGVKNTPAEMAWYYKSVDIMLIPYFNDACSNTVIEALLCGCELYKNYFLSTGGTPEIMKLYEEQGEYGLSIKRMCSDYRKVLEAL